MIFLTTVFPYGGFFIIWLIISQRCFTPLKTGQWAKSEEKITGALDHIWHLGLVLCGELLAAIVLAPMTQLSLDI
jgi:hypothetical protein